MGVAEVSKLKKLTFIIYAYPYNKNVGGICALHYLAHELVRLNQGDVYLTTGFTNSRWNGIGIDRDLPFFLEGDQSFFSRFYWWLTALKKYVIFDTFRRKITRLQEHIFPDLLWRHFDKKRTVVIYAEVVRGNPLNATHVVRWIMNTPGVCGGDGIYDLRDHIFQYHPWYPVNEKYKVQGLLTAIDLDHQLKTYQNKNRPERKGGAYLVRKGRDKHHNQHPADFVHADPLLEKMNDEEAAVFFNSIDTFISYDDMTFISVQAALCGCKSIIVPGEGERSEENLKKINRIKGVAYGFDDQEWVNSTAHQLRPYFEALNAENLATIQGFYEYCEKNIPREKALLAR
jgi:hypothetical protein